ncbi:MAG: ABC transporter ATP-binding protein [Planctomycetota bacterium]|nr:ABC transporter ATP-binding protein [Planctomycetota bacterium]
MAEAMVTVENLRKTFGNVVAVDSISFKVHRGEILGLLGPNGAGKTTTMRILTCYIAPDSGTAKVAGADITDDPLEVKRHIGYLPENAPVYTEMSVKEYLRFMADVRGCKGSARKERIEWVVEHCGLQPKYLATIGTLSKGYRQRVGLAQAMIHDPDLLILDEPTSGLDPRQIIEIRDLIREIGKTKTVFLSTHIMQEVEAICSRSVIIHKGKLVADGKPDELRTAAAGASRVVARIKAPPEELRGELGRLQGAGEVSVEAAEGAAAGGAVWCDCRISFQKGMDPEEGGERIFALVRDRGWSLRRLQFERISMEDVFLQLTREGAA